MSLAQAQALTDVVLRAWRLPMPGEQGDKEQRGHVLVVAGGNQMPGAALLAGTAALRAGAGKLVLATAESVAPGVAVALPEARVIGLPETADGGLALGGVAALEALATSNDALLIGPGMRDEAATRALVMALLPHFRTSAVILDALAIQAARSIGRFEQPVLLTPHAGEMARLGATTKEEVLADPQGAALRGASRWNAVLALKGSTSFIATPHGRAWHHERGNVGLATSGSGDVLAGLIAGLAARGASLPQAAAWGIALHARAGERLAQRLGPLGFIARELALEIPALMRELTGETVMSDTNKPEPKKTDEAGQAKPEPQPGAHGTTGTASLPTGGEHPSKTGKAPPAGRATKSGM